MSSKQQQRRQKKKAAKAAARNKARKALRKPRARTPMRWSHGIKDSIRVPIDPTQHADVLLPFREIPGAMYCNEETMASFDKTNPAFRRAARKMQSIDGDGWVWVIAPNGPLGNMKPRSRLIRPPGEDDE